MKKFLFSILSIFCFSALAVTVPADSLNSAVTPRNISKTICVTGWTATVRPSTSYTGKIKASLMKQNGFDMSTIDSYELDHIIPLSLGGNPKNPINLKLQSRTGADDADVKDGLERKLQCLVCSKKVTLRAAQKDIYTNWKNAASKYSSLSCKR